MVTQSAIWGQQCSRTHLHDSILCNAPWSCNPLQSAIAIHNPQMVIASDPRRGFLSHKRKEDLAITDSGKEKAHKHKQFGPVTACLGEGGGGSPDRVARGQMVMCCVRNPRNINILVRVPGREDRWPGWSRIYCLCEKVFMCAFSGPHCMSGSRKRGVEFKGGSFHDWNRHDRQNRQTRHGCLIVLYFVGQAKGG